MEMIFIEEDGRRDLLERRFIRTLIIMIIMIFAEGVVHRGHR